jgi:hypothetical protein
VSLASRAGDIYYSFRFVKLLTTPFEETDAYKLGIINQTGKRIKSKEISTSEEKNAYTVFHRLVFNVKKLLEKLPGGQSKLASYAAAFFLLKEKYDLSDNAILKILDKMDLESSDFIAENVQWYLLDDSRLSPGVYKIKEDKVDVDTCNEIAYKNDKIRVNEDCYPVGNIFGLDVYSVTHINTNKSLYVTLGEINK